MNRGNKKYTSSSVSYRLSRYEIEQSVKFLLSFSSRKLGWRFKSPEPSIYLDTFSTEHTITPAKNIVMKYTQRKFISVLLNCATLLQKRSPTTAHTYFNYCRTTPIVPLTFLYTTYTQAVSGDCAARRLQRQRFKCANIVSDFARQTFVITAPSLNCVQ